MAPFDGAIYVNLMRVIALNGQQTLGNVLDTALAPTEAACATESQATDAASCKAKVWLHVAGSNVSMDGATGLDSSGFHLLAGTEGILGDAVHLGMEVGAGQINANAPIGGHDRIQNVHAGLYAFANAGPLVISTTADAMHSNYQVSRETGIGLASANPGGSMLSGGVQAAWPIALISGQLTPKLGVLYQHQTLDGFHEHIASSNLLAPAYAVSGSRNTATSLQPYAALAFTSTISTAHVTYVPQLELGYRYNARGNTASVQVTAQDGTLFALPGTAIGRGMGEVSTKVTAMMDGSWSVSVDYHGLFASHLHDNVLSVGINKQF